MFARRSLIPSRGNAVRPVFLLLVGFFLATLVGYPVFMYILGLSTAAIVWITLLILAVAVGILAFTLHLAAAYERGERRLVAGDTWAEWTLSPDLQRRFAARERRAASIQALACALGGTALALGVGWLGGDVLLAWILGGVSLLAALVTWAFAGPPRAASGDGARRVRIGADGVQVLGRYVAFDAPLTRLRRVDLSTGELPVMRFTVSAGRRQDDVRVPVPPERLAEAADVVERFRRERDLA